MELLRLITCGSVDDGKSTLIGRLLYDSGAVQRDLMESITKTKDNQDHVNLALLTDGLKSEREQGITIDVAYKYFSTKNRNFIIADTPGHIQYTRNMISGASTASLAVILVDARNGIVEQTKRHSYIASIMGLPHILLCINKMDQVDYSRDRYEEIVKQFDLICKNMNLPDHTTIPVCALDGENIVNRSDKLGWFSGPTLIEYLENVPVEETHKSEISRFFVQTVIRPQTPEYHDYRAYAGQIQSGEFLVGDEITVYPSKKQSKISAINSFTKKMNKAVAQDSITLELEDDLDITRGDLIVTGERQPRLEKTFQANICWMNERELNPKEKYTFKVGSFETLAMVQDTITKIDMHTLEKNDSDKKIGLNDIGVVKIKTATAVPFDSYYDLNHTRCLTGAFIMIQESTNETVAAGMIL